MVLKSLEFAAGTVTPKTFEIFRFEKCKFHGIKLKGADNFIISADDTVMNEDNKKLLDTVFPNINIKGEIGKNKTLLNNEKAKKILGFKPEYSWRKIN